MEAPPQNVNMIEEKKIWHALETDEVIWGLATTLEGLTEDEARERLQRFGPNEFGGAEGAAPLHIFIDQMKSPLIYVLFVAAVISLAVGQLIDALVILGVVAVNAVIGFFQEYRAEKAMEALRQLAAPTASVIRNGERHEVPASDLVPGDLVAIATGDKVPADGRIVNAANLKIEEAALTGESVAVNKSTDRLPEDTPLAERKNVIYAGTVVTYGRAEAVVVATGLSTEVGKIAMQVATLQRERTPLQDKLASLGRIVGVIALGLAAFVVVAGLVRGFGFIEIFLFAVASAVAAIPEGLPAVITITLAIGLQRMAARHAVIRKLPAVETLGSATVICSDKTGTLTKNEMTVKALYTYGREYGVTGEGYTLEGHITLHGQKVASSDVPELLLALQTGVLCNDARLQCENTHCTIAGDPTEGSLLTAAAKAGIARADLEEQMPRLDEIPFDSERKYMATLHKAGAKRMIFVKGAPESVIGMSSGIMIDGEPTDLTDERKQAIAEINNELASKALRVLAFAYKEAPSDKSDLEADDASIELVFLGLAGMIDPPRPEAVEAIARCKQAGIRVMMATGDNKITAGAIADQMGILSEGGEVVEGREVARMSDDELAERIGRIDVFARVEPEHKLRIVNALKHNGHIVAMTGDGVNDAPALKRADIGVAMGVTGTDVAKEASEMVLTNDNFASIVAAVEEGRIIFRNIRKVVAYLLSTNAGEQLIIVTTILGGLPLPLIPVQILWINLVTDSFPALALAADPRREDVLAEPPKPPDVKIVSRGMLIRIALVAVIMTFGSVSFFYWELVNGGLMRARTVAFAILGTYQLANAINMRSPIASVFSIGFLSNRWLILAISVSFLLQVATIHLGFMQVLFRTVPLSGPEWLLIIIISSSVIWAEEIRKRLFPLADG